MSKITMFGVSSSGKTCFLYAMAQVLRNGVRHGNDCVRIIANDPLKQKKLNNGYLTLANFEWPQKSDKTESYDFKVNMQCCDASVDVIDSLEILDYRGGILDDVSDDAGKDLHQFMTWVKGSSALIFIIDGKTLINAMDPDDRDLCHRKNNNVAEQLRARMQIDYVENIFMHYKRESDDIPPVLVAISKNDLFASDYERDNGIRFVKEHLPSFFAKGSGIWAGITTMSLGLNLSTDAQSRLLGTLNLSPEFKIHIPVIFGIYAELSAQYVATSNPNDQKILALLLKTLRNIMNDNVQLFISGKPAYEI